MDEEEEERDEGEVTDAHAVKVDDPELLALFEEAAADQARARDAALATEMIADVHASEALTAGMIADVNNFTVQWTARFEPHILKQTAVRPYSTPSSTGQPTTGSTGAGSTWMSREVDWRADKSVDAPRDLPSGTESRLMNAACARACMPQLSTLLALGTHEKNMKRSGAEQLLLIWSGCGGRLNGVAVATAKRRCSGDAPCHAWSRCRFTGVCYPAEHHSCRLHWARHRLQCSSSARLWAAACVPGGIGPFGGRNARRRPTKAKKAMAAQYQSIKMHVVAVSF